MERGVKNGFLVTAAPSSSPPAYNGRCIVLFFRLAVAVSKMLMLMLMLMLWLHSGDYAEAAASSVNSTPTSHVEGCTPPIAGCFETVRSCIWRPRLRQTIYLETWHMVHVRQEQMSHSLTCTLW